MDRQAVVAEAQRQRRIERRLKRQQIAGTGEKLRWRFGDSRVGQRSVAALVRFLFDWSRMVGRKDAYAVAGQVMRLVGPLTREHRLARANLAGAFPDMPRGRRAEILSRAWDHLGRASVEYAFLDDLVAAFDPDRNGNGAITFIGLEQVFALRDGGRPSIMFAAHIGNWELPAALGAKMGLHVAALYRPPANPHVAEEMERRRRFIKTLVVSRKGAALQVAKALRRGEHVGIIVDQRISDGQKIDFLGRASLSNPLVGVLARMFDFPVHGARAIRRPGGGFMVELTPALELPRDANGRVDAEGANILVHGLVERWIREDPEQWLWMHDRWRI